MKIKLYSALIIFLCFGLYQGHQSFKDIQHFDQQFAQTHFDLSVPQTVPLDVSSQEIQAEIQEDVQTTELRENESIQNENSKTIEQVKEASTAYQATDKDPLLHLSDDIKNSKFFAQLSDFSRDELDLVMKAKDRKGLVNLSIQVINELHACLSDGRCVEDVDLNSDYFRNGHTRSHQLLERSLHTLIILQEEDETLRNAMSFEDKLSILDIDNSEIQRLGLELLGTQELNSKQVNSILDKDAVLGQEVQGALFTQVERYTRSEPKLREKYLSHLQQQFASDPAAAIEILKVLPFAKLEESEIAQVSRGLCLHKNNSTSQNWQAIEMHHSLYQDSQGLSTRLSSLCSAQ